MNRYEMDKSLVDAAVSKFPETFSLRAFPGDVFRLSTKSSYVNDSGVVMLYTEVNKHDKWMSFAKSTEAELRAEII